MNYSYNKRLKKYSSDMRKNMTKEERRLWFEFLRDLPIRVRRQKIIGNYIVDFYCAEKHLAIELDGSQHYSPDTADYEHLRNEYLCSVGINVLRYSNSDINNNFEGVCADIMLKLGLM